MSGEPSFIAMTVSALAVDPLTGAPMVILTDDAGVVVVPVGIGLGEASAIAAELDRIDLERPMTHQLMADLIAAAGATITRIELRPNGAERGRTFAAVVTIKCPTGNTVDRDARPSDAFALALRCGAPVWVAVSLLDALAPRGLLSPSWTPDTDDAEDAFACPGTDPALLERLGPEAFGKWKM